MDENYSELLEKYNDTIKKYEEIKKKLEECQTKNIELEKDNLILQYERSKALRELNAMRENMIATEIKKRFPDLVKET